LGVDATEIQRGQACGGGQGTARSARDKAGQKRKINGGTWVAPKASSAQGCKIRRTKLGGYPQFRDPWGRGNKDGKKKHIKDRGETGARRQRPGGTTTEVRKKKWGLS